MLGKLTLHSLHQTDRAPHSLLLAVVSLLLYVQGGPVGAVFERSFRGLFLFAACEQLSPLPPWLLQLYFSQVTLVKERKGASERFG